MGAALSKVGIKWQTTAFISNMGKYSEINTKFFSSIMGNFPLREPVFW